MNAPARIPRPPSETADTPTRYRLRVADYILLHEQGSFRGEQTELVNGEVFVLSPEWRPHFRIKSELLYRIRQAVEAAGLPYFVGTEGSIALSDTDMPRPDILLTSEPSGDGPIPSASVPLLVEIASTTLEDDLGGKAARYAAAGIAEYWVVDVQGQIVHQMWEPAGSEYARRAQIAFGGQIVAATITGLTIATSTLA